MRIGFNLNNQQYPVRQNQVSFKATGFDEPFLKVVAKFCDPKERFDTELDDAIDAYAQCVEKNDPAILKKLDEYIAKTDGIKRTSLIWAKEIVQGIRKR